MTCPNCLRNAPRKANYCPKCGSRLDAVAKAAEPDRTQFVIWLVVLAVFGPGILFAILR